MTVRIAAETPLNPQFSCHRYRWPVTQAQENRETSAQMIAAHIAALRPIIVSMRSQTGHFAPLNSAITDRSESRTPPAGSWNKPVFMGMVSLERDTSPLETPRFNSALKPC